MWYRTIIKEENSVLQWKNYYRIYNNICSKKNIQKTKLN